MQALVGVTSKLYSAGLVVVVQGLPCSEACEVFPGQGLICVSCTGRQILYHRPTREAQTMRISGRRDWPIMSRDAERSGSSKT